MLPLENYIKDLLYRYNCVIIPGFGAFLTHTQSAQNHKLNHTFYPPKKTLSFNAQLKSNDGLLANYIAEVNKIPYNVALNKIKSSVDQIKSYLNQKETIFLKDIGSLILNLEGNVVFEPLLYVNYLPNAFGLKHVIYNKIDRFSVTGAPLSVAAPVSNKENLNTTKAPRHVKRFVWMKFAATILLLLSISVLIAYNYLNNKILRHNELSEQNAQNQLNSKVQEATFIINTPLPAVTFSLTKQTGKFHIVAGAFAIEANAERKIKKLRLLGFKSKNLGKNAKGLFVVTYGSFASLIEAKRDLKIIQKEYNPDAWIYIKTI